MIERVPGDPERVSGPRVVPMLPTPRRRHLQAKLRVGAADDPHEREADRIADEVVAAIESVEPSRPDQLSRTPFTRIARSAAVVGREGGQVDGRVESRIRSARGQPLPASVRESMERGFGADFGKVRVHTAGDLASQLGAIAFTTGTDIHVAPGAFAPDSGAGRDLLAHELAHVVQQGGATTAAHRVTADTTLIQRKEPRSKNPHNPQTGITSHHVIPHELLETLIDKFPKDEKEKILRGFLPDFDQLTLGNFIAQVSVGVVYDNKSPDKVTELDPVLVTTPFGRLSDADKGKTRFKVEDAGLITFDEFRALWEQLVSGEEVTKDGEKVSGLRDVGESFYEWQGGNLFYGPERIEPGAKDGFDYDAAMVHGEAHAHKLEVIYKQLRALEKANDPVSKAKIVDLLAELNAAAKNVGVPPYDPNLWQPIGSPERKQALDVLLPERTKTSKVGATIHKKVLRDGITSYCRAGAHAMLRYMGRAIPKKASGANSPDQLFEAKGRAIYLKADPRRQEVLDEGLKKRDDVERAMRELLLVFFGLPATA